MTATAIESFADSLSASSVPLTRTTATEASDELAALVEGPAVGAPLPFEGVALPDGVVVEPSPSDLDAARTGVTAARPAVADYGSVVVAGRGDLAEAVSLYAEEHVAVVAASDVEQSMREGVEAVGEEVREGLTSAVVATGPSATADMGELVLGAHGPTSVRVLLLEDR